MLADKRETESDENSTGMCYIKYEEKFYNISSDTLFSMFDSSKYINAMTRRMKKNGINFVHSDGVTG